MDQGVKTEVRIHSVGIFFVVFFLEKNGICLCIKPDYNELGHGETVPELDGVRILPYKQQNIHKQLHFVFCTGTFKGVS